MDYLTNSEPVDATLERFRNFLRFQILFRSQETILNSSPDYIQEKWTKLIGFEPKVDFNREDYISLDDFFRDYEKIWGESKLVERQIVFLVMTDSNHFLRISTMIELFERVLGPFDDICIKSFGLIHPNLEERITSDLERNKEVVNKILTEYRRNSNLNDLLD